MISFSRLTELAEKATPGPYKFSGSQFYVHTSHPPYHVIPHTNDDHMFRAACSPDVVMKLVKIARLAKEFMSNVPTGIPQRLRLRDELLEELKEVEP